MRSKLHLLTPERIRANIEKLGLTQQELAEWLDVAPETVSRWMTGALIQSSRTNKRLRLFFAFPAARDMLRRLDEDPQLGIEVCLQRGKGQDSQLATFQDDQEIPLSLLDSTKSGERAGAQAGEVHREGHPEA